ncbi:MAG: hypothetical protein B7Y05_17470 [Polynucleobacter sp. 24-46-87]|nr:MAG: hypothetical protein B7Y05_17470 [Polynucleobacter sp. 24-46-87]
MLEYPARLTKDDPNILVTFRDVPEAITFGANEKRRSKMQLMHLRLDYLFTLIMAKIAQSLALRLMVNV